MSIDSLAALRLPVARCSADQPIGTSAARHKSPASASHNSIPEYWRATDVVTGTAIRAMIVPALFPASHRRGAGSDRCTR
jgi:hypothetical protein